MLLVKIFYKTLYEKAGDTFLIIKYKTEIIGYIIAYLDFDDENYEEDVFFIGSLLIAKSYRGKGLSNLLLEYTLDKLAKYGINGKSSYGNKVLLHVKVSNTVAVNLYFKFGFKVKSLIKDYYKTEDAFLMEKILNKNNKDRHSKDDTEGKEVKII